MANPTAPPPMTMVSTESISDIHAVKEISDDHSRAAFEASDAPFFEVAQCNTTI
jgi:hypothetical protein